MLERGQLVLRCKVLSDLFNLLERTNGRIDKEELIIEFKILHPKLLKDLDFCFEVLAGKHKVGYTYNLVISDNKVYEQYKDYTVRKFYNEVLKAQDSSIDGRFAAGVLTPPAARIFFSKLVNREYRLGYSNKESMITNYSPMLAKKYQDTFREQYYYIQEKLDGNRCIARFNTDTNNWEFWSRSGKELKVNFDMSWVDVWLKNRGLDGLIEYPIFDGEIMTLEHAGTRDFNRTSGAINGKYTDKSGLHYFIYDIVADKLKYEERKQILDSITTDNSNCHILPVLDKVWVYPNHNYNTALDNWLDTITDKGGEGIMLRDPDGYYQCGKRSNGLLKYKKVQTMDLRVVGWNEGNGKYEGAVGSWQCETDDGDIKVNVSGMPDDLHYAVNPDALIGSIVEVAYFDISINSATGQKSLRFPRLKFMRTDKDTTSIY